MWGIMAVVNCEKVGKGDSMCADHRQYEAFYDDWDLDSMLCDVN